jgi:hypothetical protein
MMALCWQGPVSLLSGQAVPLAQAQADFVVMGNTLYSVVQSVRLARDLRWQLFAKILVGPDLQRRMCLGRWVATCMAGRTGSMATSFQYASVACAEN